MSSSVVHLDGKTKSSWTCFYMDTKLLPHHSSCPKCCWNGASTLPILLSCGLSLPRSSPFWFTCHTVTAAPAQQQGHTAPPPPPPAPGLSVPLLFSLLLSAMLECSRVAEGKRRKEGVMEQKWEREWKGAICSPSPPPPFWSQSPALRCSLEWWKGSLATSQFPL